MLHADPIREVSAGRRRNYRQKWPLLKEQFNGVKAAADVYAKFLPALRETRSNVMMRDGNPS